MQDGKENVAQFELIPWILGQCASMKEVHELLDRINIVNTPFSPQFPLALLINREDAVRWQRVNMRLPCIHPAAMPRKVFITTIPMKTTRSVVDMHRENLDSDHPIRYPAIQGEKIHFQN